MAPLPQIAVQLQTVASFRFGYFRTVGVGAGGSRPRGQSVSLPLALPLPPSQKNPTPTASPRTSTGSNNSDKSYTHIEVVPVVLVGRRRTCRTSWTVHKVGLLAIAQVVADYHPFFVVAHYCPTSLGQNPVLFVDGLEEQAE